MDYVFEKIELRHMGISLNEYRHQNTWVALSIEGPLIIAVFMKHIRQA